MTEQVIAYQRKRLTDHAVDRPRRARPAGAELPDPGALVRAAATSSPAPARSPPEVLLGALHATEHSQIAVLPLIAMCDRWDIGGLSTNIHFQTGLPTIFIYDGHPGGVGITRRGFERVRASGRRRRAPVGECPCEDGCPSCVQSPKCGNLNEPLHKAGALELMRAMLDRPERAGGAHDLGARSRVVGTRRPTSAGAARRGGRPPARRGRRGRRLRRAGRRDGGGRARRPPAPGGR